MTHGSGPEGDDPAAATTPPPSTALTWDEFERRLATTLAEMAEETFLVISTPMSRDGTAYYVQFASGESYGLRAEAVGSGNLPPARALAPGQEAQLVELGWQRPAPDDPCRNYVRTWPRPAPFEEIARLAVRTLREVHGIEAPADLRYVYAAFGDRAVPVLDLGIEAQRRSPPPAPTRRPRRAVADLTPLVERSLARWLGASEVVRDRDGDYPIRVGSALMFVRLVDGVPPVVRIFSPILHDIAESQALLAALNEINGQIRFGRVFWMARQVIVAMELTAVDISADQVAFACIELGNLADHLDDGLHGRFGGATMFPARATLVN